MRRRWWTCGSELFKGMETEAAESNLYFTFGVIADIQYANVPNGLNYSRTRERYYRNSLCLLRGAIKEWNEECVAPKFILQLGDVIDGCNSQIKASEEALKTVINHFTNCVAPVHHIWGNHEFYNFDRTQLQQSALNSKHLEGDIVSGNMSSFNVKPEINNDDSEAFYGYHFSPFPKFRFIITDAYDLSIHGRKKSSKKHNDSVQILKSNNKNEDTNSPEGLAEPNLHFLGFNGGFSQDQLEWLNNILNFSDCNQEKVTVIGHLPVHPVSSGPICVAWNYNEMLSMLHTHSSVICFLAGHDHDGGYHLDDHGIHHLTFEGVIETSPGSQAFGTVYVYEDRMILKGRGRTPSRVLRYREKIN